MKLFGYWRSGTSHRVRIALNLKGLAYDYIPVNLLKGEQREEDWRTDFNAQSLVPVLELDDGARLTQSTAIIEYLEEAHPAPAFLPADLNGRATVRAIAAALACEAQPLQNLRVQRYLRHTLDADDAGVKAWLETWVGGTLAAVEEMAKRAGGAFCVGDEPTMADIFLMPQMYGAARFGVDLDPYPTLRAIAAACDKLSAFDKARPENQPDAVL